MEQNIHGEKWEMSLRKYIAVSQDGRHVFEAILTHPEVSYTQ